MHADVRWGKIGWSLYSGVLMPRLNQKCRVSVRRGMSLTDQQGGSMESSGDIAAPRYLYLSSFIIANTRQHDGEQNFINVGGGITAAQEHQMVFRNNVPDSGYCGSSDRLHGDLEFVSWLSSVPDDCGTVRHTPRPQDPKLYSRTVVGRIGRNRRHCYYVIGTV
jgi:hypothetical protein